MRVTNRCDNIIYVDFTKKHTPKLKPSRPTGVFVKPMQSDVSQYWLKGNLSGFIASYVAFHPDFNPSMFGNQVRSEMGIDTNDNPEPPEAA